MLAKNTSQAYMEYGYEQFYSMLHENGKLNEPTKPSHLIENQKQSNETR
jgi:hypothetical protein